MSDVIEGTVEAPGELVRVDQPPALSLAPQLNAQDLVQRLDVIREASEKAMQPDVDYGVIPGTGSKPTLLKPGAEKLAVLFQLDVQLENERIWHEGDHLTVMSRATVYHAPTGNRLGFGEGTCSTKEKKYAKRKAKAMCPECKQEAIFKSKHPPRDNPNAEPGWFCWKKEGGCGKNYAADDPAITSQKVGEVDNPDLPDQWNTVVKMAEKRARVDAILAVTGASAIFTQDAEDLRLPASSAPTQPVVRDVEHTGKSDLTLTTAGGISDAEFEDLKRLFNQAGRPTERVTELLDSLGAPARAQFGVRIKHVSPEVARELRAFLVDAVEQAA